MDREGIISLLGENWQAVQKRISSALSSDVQLLNSVNSGIMEHSGKQLRPMMGLLFAGACGGINEDSVAYAAAVELLHNATLLHDDVADESVKRRGNPTVFSLLGPSAAVLVGDFWLSRAVDVILSATSNKAVIGLFSKTLTDLAEGEMLQLQKASSADTTEGDYYRIIFCKTASLFEVACVSAAISAGASEEWMEIAGKYASALGYAFQIKDDILDYSGDSCLGKPTGVDIIEGKITLPLLGALKNSPRNEEIRSLVKNIADCPENAEVIKSFVYENGGVEYASARLEEYIEKAIEAIQPLPCTKYRTCLEEIARYNSIRKK